MSPKKHTLSVIVIAKNEEARIGRCLASVRFADEIIVLDNGSVDDTSEIAQKHGAVVKTFQTTDFARLRNEGAKLVGSEWMLYIDADEIVTAQLARSIRSRKHIYAGYEIHRKNYYLGVLWPRGEWMLRLFKKSAFQTWRGELHESAIVKGVVGRLTGDLTHDTHRTLAEMVAKTNELSETEAALRFNTHHPPITWWRILRMMASAFWDSYFRQGGWRVGIVGVIESMYQGFSMFVTYAKLWEMQQGKK